MNLHVPRDYSNLKLARSINSATSACMSTEMYNVSFPSSRDNALRVYDYLRSRSRHICVTFQEEAPLLRHYFEMNSQAVPLLAKDSA